jgi:hypothetical protein
MHLAEPLLADKPNKRLTNRRKHYDFVNEQELRIREADVGISGANSISLMLNHKTNEDAQYQLTMSRREARKLLHELREVLELPQAPAPGNN